MLQLRSIVSFFYTEENPQAETEPIGNFKYWWNRGQQKKLVNLLSN